VSVLWSDDPDAWAPQNLSCDANARCDGLDVVATRAIAAGEALTIDYGLLTALDAEPFDCTCRAATCRGRVTRREGNSVTRSELRKRQLRKRQLRTRGTTYAGTTQQRERSIEGPRYGKRSKVVTRRSDSPSAMIGLAIT
jgi:hypothetical protein